MTGSSEARQTADPDLLIGRLLFAPGAVVSSFEVTRLIAAGGMSQVFEARDQRLNRVVALKAAEAGSFGGSILRKEGQALAAIRSPAVPTIYGMGVENGIEYLVMERIAGMTLDAMLRRRPGRPPFTIPDAI